MKRAVIPASLLLGSSSETAGGAGFVVCALTDLLLVIPQVDVVAIEHGTEFSAPEVGESTISWFDGVHGKWPVCALDSDLRPCPTLHASGSFLLFVKSAPVPVGLRCEYVRIVH